MLPETQKQITLMENQPEKPEIDYRAVFTDEYQKTVEEFGNPENIAVGDDASLDRICDTIKQRMLLLEAAIEELRIRHQAKNKYRDDAKSRMSKAKREETSQKDMEFRQKKQQEKIDRQVAMAELQRQQLIETLQKINMPTAQIDAMLVSKGFKPLE